MKLMQRSIHLYRNEKNKFQLLTEVTFPWPNERSAQLHTPNDMLSDTSDFEVNTTRNAAFVEL